MSLYFQNACDYTNGMMKPTMFVPLDDHSDFLQHFRELEQQNAALVKALETLQDHHCGSMCGVDDEHSKVMDMVNKALALVEGDTDG